MTAPADDRRAIERRALDELRRALAADRARRLGILAPIAAAIDRIAARLSRAPDWPARP